LEGLKPGAFKLSHPELNRRRMASTPTAFKMYTAPTSRSRSSMPFLCACSSDRSVFLSAPFKRTPSASASASRAFMMAVGERHVAASLASATAASMA
jgi:hypothetical protein